MRKPFSIFLVLVLSACMTRQADLTAYSPAGKQQPAVFLVKDIEYDPQGRPVFGSRLKARPTGEGEQFTVVQSVDDRPTKSFDIVITPERADPTRPFKVIYEWTGKGFKIAAGGSKAYAENVIKDRDTRTVQPSSSTASETFMSVGPVLFLSIGGFIVGLAASIPAAIVEAGHVIVNAREKVISYSVYEYDGLKRLARIKTYLPSDISREIIKTIFFYQNDESTPVKTEITSYPENTVRTIP